MLDASLRIIDGTFTLSQDAVVKSIETGFAKAGYKITAESRQSETQIQWNIKKIEPWITGARYFPKYLVRLTSLDLPIIAFMWPSCRFAEDDGKETATTLCESFRFHRFVVESTTSASIFSYTLQDQLMDALRRQLQAN